MKLQETFRVIWAGLLIILVCLFSRILPSSSSNAARLQETNCQAPNGRPIPCPSPTVRLCKDPKTGKRVPCKPAPPPPPPPPPPVCNAKGSQEIYFNEVKDERISRSESSCRRDGARVIYYNEYKLRLTRSDQFVIQLVPYLERSESSATENVTSGAPGDRQKSEVITLNLDDPLFNMRLLDPNNTSVEFQPRANGALKDGLHYLAKGHVAADGDYKLQVEYLSAQNNARYALRVRKPQLSLDLNQPVVSGWHVALSQTQKTEIPRVDNTWDDYELSLTQEDWFTIDLKATKSNYQPKLVVMPVNGDEQKGLELTPDPATPGRWNLKTRLLSDGRFSLRVRCNINTASDRFVEYTVSISRRDWPQNEYNDRVEEIFKVHIEQPATKNPDEAILRLKKLKTLANGKPGPKAAEYLGFIQLYEKDKRLEALAETWEAINQGGDGLFRVRTTKDNQVRWLKINRDRYLFTGGTGPCENCGPFLLQNLKPFDPTKNKGDRIMFRDSRRDLEFTVEPPKINVQSLLTQVSRERALPKQ